MQPRSMCACSVFDVSVTNKPTVEDPRIVCWAGQQAAMFQRFPVCSGSQPLHALWTGGNPHSDLDMGVLWFHGNATVC